MKKVVQQFLDEIVSELGKEQLFGVPGLRGFREQVAQGTPSPEPQDLGTGGRAEERTVKFKVGRLMKQKLAALSGAVVDDEAGDVAEMPEGPDDTAEEEETAEGSGAALRMVGCRSPIGLR